LAISNARIEQLVSAGLSFSNSPGQTFEYSNLGYIMLGKVVSKASGMRFQDYVTQEILRPLGMHDTRWEYTQASPGKLALGYRWDRDHSEVEPILSDGDGAAMGGLITTADDFAHYITWMPGRPAAMRIADRCAAHRCARCICRRSLPG